MADTLIPLAGDARAVLALEPLLGDLAGHPALVLGVTDWLAAMEVHGTLAALGRYLDGD